MNRYLPARCSLAATAIVFRNLKFRLKQMDINHERKQFRFGILAQTQTNSVRHLDEEQVKATAT